MIPIHNLINSTFCQRVAFILTRMSGGHTKARIDEAVRQAYTREKFGTSAIVPIMPASEHEYVAEFWHGPTGSFKNIPAALLPLLIPRGSLVLMATAGNAGVANLEGFRDVNGIRLISFYPLGSIGELHRLMMITQNTENAITVGVDATLVEMQKKLDKIVADESFAEKLRRRSLSPVSLDNIKLGRVEPLAACLFSVYCELVRHGEITEGENIAFRIPQEHGTLVKAADLAKTLGLPIDSKAQKIVTIETEDPNINEELLLKKYRQKPIMCDAICTLDNMKRFIAMMV